MNDNLDLIKKIVTLEALKFVIKELEEIKEINNDDFLGN